MAETRAIRLAKRPGELLDPADLAVERAELPPFEAGKIRLAMRYIALDPLTRIFMGPAPLGGAVPPMPIGTVITGPGLAEVVESQHEGFAVGDWVEGRLPWQEAAITDGAGLRKVDLSLGSPTSALGAMGLPGFTAYVGLRLAPHLQPGATVLVSGAAGAVGSLFGQLAKAKGFHVVGLASSAEKRKYLIDELGFDAAIDGRAGDVEAQLKAAAPQGCDLYFDNVGGELFVKALGAMKQMGHVLICGLISYYGGVDQPVGPDMLPAALLKIMSKSLTVRGFGNVFYIREMDADFRKEVGPMVRAGTIKLPEHLGHGFETIPQAYADVFRASHIGKALVKLA